ncbi:MAG: DUF4159 domain-containing protein [Gemmataceae bacterium]|nr:DUF4159 domain-containing protein [Gemmataceae bacterium]
MRCVLPVALCAVSTLWLGQTGAGQKPAAPAEKTPLVEQVGKANDTGVKWLRQQQKKDGSWDNIDRFSHPGGTTALALHALLNSGVEPTDPTITKGLAYLRAEVRNPTTYVRALQTMVYVEAGRAEDRKRIQDNVDHLIRIRIFRGLKFWRWSYDYPNNPNTMPDHSNTQYAVLALHAAAQAGARIDRQVWREIRQLLLDSQTHAGGWSYGTDERTERSASVSMTNAGLCGLLIAGLHGGGGRERLRPDGEPRGYEDSEALKKGLSWISSPDRDRFSLELQHRTFSNLHGIECAGRLSGLRFFHSHDWYREGCQWLVKHQRRADDGSGYWNESALFDSWPVVSTSFALLFLAQGRTPVLISRLAHGPSPRVDNDLDWNHDRYALHHLTAFAARELFKTRRLAWQVFDIRSAALARRADRPGKEDRRALTAELLESPVVYLSGHKSPATRFTDAEVEILRQYVAHGGTILAEACRDSKDFDRGFHALCAERLFPGEALRPLPAGHSVWKAWAVVDPGKSPALKGIERAGRTVVIYSPEDLAFRWESNRLTEPRVLDTFRLGANILAYATGRKLPPPRLTPIGVK